MAKYLLNYRDFVKSYNIRKNQLERVRHWFPIRPSSELAEIVAAILTDGHIDWNDYEKGISRPKKLVLYSNYKNECTWFIELVYFLFNEKGKIIKYTPTTGFSKNESYKAVVYCAPLARLLIKLGVPCGDKTLRNYLVPDWIMNGTRNIKRSFLRTLFNFDGSISIRKIRGSAEINFCFNKHQTCADNGMKFMLQILALLGEFSIKTGKIHKRRVVYKACADKFAFMLFIANNKSIINYYRKIGFLNRKKQNKLSSYIYKLFKNARIPSDFLPKLLTELKEKFGSDKETISEINKYSKVHFTYRQFEHIRRGEGKIPIQMVIAAIKILNKRNYFKRIPEHYRYLISTYDNFFPQ